MLNNLRTILLCALLAVPALAQPKALVLISIDGMSPAYVTAADQYKLKIPTLRRLMTQGAHAEGVRNVMPTNTYPNHTTLITGVWPAKHGIANNLTLDHPHKNMDGWYWYAEDIQVPTLWDAASKAGLKVGSVSWPVSVGAKSVNFLIPEYWRSQTGEDRKLMRAVSTPGLFAELEPEAGPYITDLADAIRGDTARTNYALAIIRRKHARFITIHLAALDHLEHETGPFSPEAFQTLEQIDAMVASIEKAMRDETPDTVLCVVSDHGFAATDKSLNLAAMFTEAKIPAFVWGAGGSSYITLNEAKDAPAREKVAAYLAKLASDPANGIDRIMDRKEIASLGGTPIADFAVDMKPPYATGTGKKPGVESAKPGGKHGYAPTHKEMRSSFFIQGPGVKAALNLGEIDMRTIAPTLAKLMGWSFSTAEVAPTDLGR